MKRDEFDVLCAIVKKKRGPKTRPSVIEDAYFLKQTGEGNRDARRFLDRIETTREMLEQSEGDLVALANSHADSNGAVADAVFDAAIDSILKSLPATKTAVEHGCYSASVYNFIKCIKSAKQDYDDWKEVK
jgi:hypothetical protein